MLVLARKPEQWIQIGPDIQIHVLEVARGKVRLGVVAPLSMTILRGPELVTSAGVPKFPQPSGPAGPQGHPDDDE